MCELSSLEEEVILLEVMFLQDSTALYATQANLNHACSGKVEVDLEYGECISVLANREM